MNGTSPESQTNGRPAGPGFGDGKLNRADELEDLLEAVKSLIIPFVRAADAAAPERASGRITDPSASHTALVEPFEPAALVEKLRFSLPDGEGPGEGKNAPGRDRLLDLVRDVLRYSVNTWDQGFLDKLYSSTNPVGVISELILAVLNTNVHVYATSPALTVIEKATARRLAALFGFTGPRAGGIVCQGGSASNMTSVVVARNTLYPETREAGNAGRRFVLFTSEHGHYSVEKAAVACGMGASNVVTVPVDNEGRMIPSALREAIAQAESSGGTPLYVNATAGTTVHGSYDPFDAIADICAGGQRRLWLHVDGAWGGSAVFSARQRERGQLRGVERADSVAVNPHKMLNVPLTCSFLLTPDLRVFHRANTLPAGYLFHGGGDDADTDTDADADNDDTTTWDLADQTLQCGRRGDALKLALAWTYYGTSGLAARVDAGFAAAAHLAELVQTSPDLELLSPNPPPCLQVCFYYAPGGRVAEAAAENTRRTREMAARLVRRGFMVDYAPGARGSFFRVVVNSQTLCGTLEGLVTALGEVGREVVEE